MGIVVIIHLGTRSMGVVHEPYPISNTFVIYSFKQVKELINWSICQFNSHYGQLDEWEDEEVCLG